MRLFIKPEAILGNEIAITGSDVNRLRNVLRKKIGDRVNLLDGRGSLYQAAIQSIGHNRITCKIISCHKENEQQIKIDLAQSLPKGHKIDSIIQKACELGINAFIPFISEHTASIPVKDFQQKKQLRWQKIAKQAAEQSQSAHVPQVCPIIRFKELIPSIKNYALCLIPYENEKEQHLKDVLTSGPTPASILLIIGPEGGFSPQEVKTAQTAGAVPVSLGKQILRTETAPIMALSSINYQFRI